MARKTKTEKLNTLEEQIKKLQEDKERMLVELQTSIGKHVINEWDCLDEMKLKEFISSLKEKAILELHNEDQTVTVK